MSEITSLVLKNFRSYEQKTFRFGPGVTVVVGPNASGKTNLLEAIRLLAIGRSLRAGVEAEMIAYGQEVSRVEGRVKADQEENDLAVVLTVGEIAGEKVAKKRLLVNGVGKRKMDFVKFFHAVYFGPEDLVVIFDSPSGRRDWLDSILESVDPEYYRANLSYQKGLRQRNKLLEQIREEGRPRSVLFFWNKLLIENGQTVTQKRAELIEFINAQPKRFDQLQVEYDKSVVSPQRLQQYADAEIAAGMTLVGPHRDDFRVQGAKGETHQAGGQGGKETRRDLHIFGSRGEQRLAVFVLKMAELAFVMKKMAEQPAIAVGRPVLLLDDIFSELDRQHRQELLQHVGRQQTIITTTDIRLIEPEYQDKIAIVEL